MSDDAETTPEIKCKVDCPCGWTEIFSRAYSGLQIECPRCGKTHRIPTFDKPNADDAIDMSTMRQLLGNDSAPTPGTGPRVTVPFKRLFVLALAIAVIISAIALPLLWGRWPVNAAVVGGAFAWPLAISVAWLGQTRQIKKMNAAS
ncbi:MAG: hypothetical protein K8I27_11915 [Planctomycetes bacterium]|nr:hypothetical protein [Planctomycetota bacterium]